MRQQSLLLSSATCKAGVSDIRGLHLLHKTRTKLTSGDLDALAIAFSAALDVAGILCAGATAFVAENLTAIGDLDVLAEIQILKSHKQRKLQVGSLLHVVGTYNTNTNTNIINNT
jgi:hypothetical protein